MKNNDVQLIHRILDGDDAAFAELVEKYKKQVHVLVWRKIGDFHIAEEITQDTFLNAYQKLGTLKKPQHFASWLYVIATNRCSTWLHKKRLRRQLLENKDVAQSEKATYSEYVLAENERITAETQRDVVNKLLAKLGESERTVMTLHYLGEMSCTEIGAFLGVSANTVKSRLRRAQQRLQKEEPMIREALDHFQITPNLTDNIMREISHKKPISPSNSKPLVPWAIVASTIAVVLLMLGFGNNQYLARFQKPYSLDTTAELKVDIIDAPVVANLESKPDVRMQNISTNTLAKLIDPEKHPNNDISSISEDTLTEETVKDYTKWHLPKEAKTRLGKGGIRAMQFSSDGSQLAVGSKIGVWMYDVNSGKEISLFPGKCESFAISPDGRILANVRDGSTTLWEVASGQEVTLHDLPSAASVFWFSNDSKTLVTLNKSGDTISWIDTETGKSNVKKIDNRPDLEPYPRAVYALTHDKVAIGENNGILELWNSKTGKKVSTLTGPEKKITLPYSSSRKHNVVISLAFSPDGTQLASGRLDNTVRLWDITDNNEHIIWQKQESDSPQVLVFSPDGKTLASGDDNKVRLWDTATGESLTTFTGHISKVYKLAFSPDGSTLTSASRDGTVLFWNSKTGDQLPQNITKHTADVRTISFMNDSSTLASVSYYRGIITLWNLKTGQTTIHHTKTAFEETVDLAISRLLAFSPDGSILASNGYQFNPNTPSGRNSLMRLTDVSTGRGLITKTHINGEDWSSVLTFSPDGKTAAYGVRNYNNSNGKIRLWNIETNKMRDIQYADQADVWINALAFSPNGDKLVIGTSDGNVEMWDVESGGVLTSFIGQISKKERITALSFSSNGVLLAVGNYKRIRVMASSKLTLLREIDGRVETLVFVPDSSVLVSGRRGGAIELWDIETGDKLTTLEGHTEAVQTLAFSPDGKTLVSTGGDGTILLWDWEEVLNGLEQ